MAQFNLADYETVEERIRRFYTDHPDGRIITENLTTLQDRQVSTWVVRAQIWMPLYDTAAGDLGVLGECQPADLFFLKATGLAFEVDGNKGPNQTSALENCETSAIGRALANAGYSGNKRVTREEMAKVQRGVTPKPVADAAFDYNALAAQIMAASTKTELREIWAANTAHLDQLLPGTEQTFKAAIISMQKRLPEEV